MSVCDHPQIETAMSTFAAYVDDLATATKDPVEICKTLWQAYNFNLKGDSPLAYQIRYAYK